MCEGQECECDFSEIGQNSEMIQTVRSRSFCLRRMEFGCFFLCKGRVTETNRSSKNRSVKVDPNNSPNRFSCGIRVRAGEGLGRGISDRLWLGKGIDRFQVRHVAVVGREQLSSADRRAF